MIFLFLVYSLIIIFYFILLNIYSTLQAPYLIYVEIIEVDDVQGSPIPPKMINALRQTRSEENLPDYFGVQDFSGISFSLHPSVDDDGDCWTQEDDAISLQVLKELG